MSTQWTMTWLVRWRVRDWASCFLASKLPLDDHEMVSSSHMAARNMAFDKRKDNSFNSISHNNNWSQRSKKCSKTRQLSSPMRKDKKDGINAGKGFDDSSWSLSTDEDFIVFCFREDGAFDVVRDGRDVKSEAVIRGADEKHKKPRPVNRKLNYGEDEEQVSDLNIQEKISNDANQQDSDEQYQDCITFSKEEEARVKDRQQQYGNNIEEETALRQHCRMVSAESRDSDQSEGSAGSFAFPVLSWEWMESPVKMPKSEGICQKKQKVRFVRFQCCRF